MNESKDNPFEKYSDIALTLCYFIIPFFGLKMALKNYLGEDNLSLTYLLLLIFIAGNIMTCLIFILNENSRKSKLIWTGGLLFAVVILNFFIR